jgi:CHAD domain-containing protein
MRTNEQPEITEFAATTIIKSIVELQKSIQNVGRRKNTEDVHDMRVASRRVREALEVFSQYLPSKKYRYWQKSIQNLTRTFGNARDLDVQVTFITSYYQNLSNPLLRPGARRLVLRLNQKRKKMQQELKSTLKELEKTGILQDITTTLEPFIDQTATEIVKSDSLFQMAFNFINKRLEEFLFYEIYIPYPEHIKELHLMRIAAKRLRYTMEIFTIFYSDKMDRAMEVIRSAQTCLGEIRDCDVWLIYLTKFMQKEKKNIIDFYGNTRPYGRLQPGLEGIQINREKERENLFKTFLRNWNSWNQEEIWIRLRQLIFEPTLQRTITQPQPPNYPEIHKPQKKTPHLPANVFPSSNKKTG